MSYSESYPELIEELSASRKRNIYLIEENEKLKALVHANYDPQSAIAKMMVAFGQEVRTSPTMPNDPAERALRATLVLEEALEIVDALGCKPVMTEEGWKAKPTHEPNLIELADGIGDTLVVTYGAANFAGIQAYPILEEVNRSNMSKVGLDGRVERRPSDNKVIKGPGYSPPDIKKVLQAQGWKPEDENQDPLQPGEHATQEPKSVDSVFQSKVLPIQEDKNSTPGESPDGNGVQTGSQAAESLLHGSGSNKDVR